MMTTKTTPTKSTKKKTAAKRTAKNTSAKPPAKKTAAPRGAKVAKKTPVKKAPAKRKAGALDSAARVLVETRQPMTSRELVEAMATKGYWKSPAGKTPHATLYAAIIREIATKGKDARFIKTERGRFGLAKRGS
jgi:hypothetical protein